MLSKAEVSYLQGEKQVSDSYEYKLKSILRKKVATFLDKELPLLSSLFPNLLDLTNFSKKMEHDINTDLTEFSKTRSPSLDQRKLAGSESIEGSKTYDQSLIVQVATEFSNNKTNDATKNSNSDEKRRRERDLNPRGPHGPQAIQFPNFQACALPG
jgi:hypothetical protein